jgi:hypothetical protein
MLSLGLYALMPAHHVTRSPLLFNHCGAARSRLQRFKASDEKPALRDYRKDAATLFNNMRVPAALVNGAAVGSAFALVPTPGDPAPIAVFKRVHTLLAIATIASELNAVVTATVAINKLSEVESEPTSSVVSLLLSEGYELPWVAVNVQFFAGLFGLAAMVLIRALATMAAVPSVGRISACLMASAVLLMASVVNDGVAKTGVVPNGPTRQLPFGGTLFALTYRYMQLLWMRARRSPLVLLAVAFATAAFWLGAYDALTAFFGGAGRVFMEAP